MSHNADSYGAVARCGDQMHPWSWTSTPLSIYYIIASYVINTTELSNHCTVRRST